MSRNFRVGLGIAKGKTKEEIIKELGEVAEGIGTAYALKDIAVQKDIYLPIAMEVYEMLEGKNPNDSLKKLLKNH
jgi:glycerol-3-phosphate dehydrogenase (NAD(P)+)